MNLSPVFTSDHQGYYRRGEYFYPLIQDADSPLATWSNTLAIRLPVGSDRDEDQTCVLRKAEEAVSSGKCLLWEIELGEFCPLWKLQDATSFDTVSLMLEQFSSTLLPVFREQTLGICLYRGSSELSELFLRPASDLAYREWQEEIGTDRPHAYEVFCLNVLSDHLHRLVSILPADVLAFALFDVTSCPLFSKMAYLYLQERFEFISLGLKGAVGPHAGLCWEVGGGAHGYWGKTPSRIPAFPVTTVGLLLPEESAWTCSALEEIQQMSADLRKIGIPFRTVSEGKLTEQWDGLDYLCVSSSSLRSLQTQRKLQGFVAAGGSIVQGNEVLNRMNTEPTV